VVGEKGSSTKELRSEKKKLSSCEKVIEETKKLIIIQEKELDTAGVNQTKAIKNESRIKQIIDGEYQLLDSRKKSYMDALRVNASNIFRNVHDKFRIIFNNHRDDHVRLRMLTRCSGFIDHSKGEVCVKLWLPGTIQKHIVKSLDRLVVSIADEINGESAESDRRLKIELITGPVNFTTATKLS
jgi:hypothetical protein